MLKVLELASEYRAQGEIVPSTEKAMKSRNPILVRKAKNQRNDAKNQQQLIAKQIDGLPHRYIDGMLTNYRPHSFRCSAMLTIPMPQTSNPRCTCTSFRSVQTPLCRVFCGGLVADPFCHRWPSLSAERRAKHPRSFTYMTASRRKEPGEILATRWGFLNIPDKREVFWFVLSIHLILLLPFRQVLKEIHLDAPVWEVLEYEQARDTRQIRDQIETRKLREELDRAEFQCFLRRVKAIRKALPNISDAVLRRGLSISTEEPARDEPGGPTPAPKRSRLGPSVSK
jgi:hypothetical protein